MTIKWGNVTFEGPYQITTWDPPYKAAIYAIMIKPDSINKSDTYRIVYFGESGNLSERGFYKSHHAYGCWTKNAGHDSNLYIGVYMMPNSTQEDRTKIEQQLISEYTPVCNLG